MTIPVIDLEELSDWFGSLSAVILRKTDVGVKASGDVEVVTELLVTLPELAAIFGE